MLHSSQYKLAIIYTENVLKYYLAENVYKLLEKICWDNKLMCPWNTIQFMQRHAPLIISIHAFLVHFY